jgi:ABC-type Fe3+/spermidine/putrescine transport system ATPase subunit
LEKVLQIENLNFDIESKKIINNISLSIEKHQIFALLGESGSGKSTLLKLIAGLLEPLSGRLEVDGEIIKPPSKKLISGNEKIKIVRQDNPLFPNISLKENIEYELRFFNDEYKDKRVAKLLKLTGLNAVAHQLPRHCSEGEQQRTSIARALADEPSLLLLDEPFSNLDYKNKSTLKNKIKDIVKDEEMACIFVTHDISDVFDTADKLAILKKGEISQTDKPISIYRYPKSIYNAAMTGEYNLVSGSNAKRYLNISTDKKSILIRPEEIKIGQMSLLNGKVINQIERGVYNEITLKVAKLKLKAFSMESYKFGQMVSFKLGELNFFN